MDDVITGVCHDSRAANNHFRPHHTSQKQYIIVVCFLQKIPRDLKSRHKSVQYRVKSGIFGQTAKFGQRPCLFHISNIVIENKLPKQTVKILMRRLIRSRLI